MRLGKMTKKQVLKPSCNSDKSVAICEFVNIQFPICGIDGSKCWTFFRQHILLHGMWKCWEFLRQCNHIATDVKILRIFRQHIYVASDAKILPYIFKKPLLHCGVFSCLYCSIISFLYCTIFSASNAQCFYVSLL